MNGDDERLAVANVVRALERAAEPGERLLIAMDTGTDENVHAVLVAAASEYGVATEVVSPRPASAPNAEPPSETADALGRCDLVMLATTVPISHTAAVRRAVARGARILAMDGVTVDMLATGGGAADYERMHELGLVLEALWNAASHMRLTSEAGTDLEADVSQRLSWRWDGYPFHADWYELTGCALPDGEVGIAPLEGSANGVVVWDTSVHSLGLLRQAVRLSVEQGWVVDIAGGEQARELSDRLAAQDDRNSYYCPAEVAIGINEAARITGSLREDKKALGTVHVAIGTNSDIGGTIEARTHIDGIIRYPTLLLDEKSVVKAGRLMVEA